MPSKEPESVPTSRGSTPTRKRKRRQDKQNKPSSSKVTLDEPTNDKTSESTDGERKSRKKKTRRAREKRSTADVEMQLDTPLDVEALGGNAPEIRTAPPPLGTGADFISFDDLSEEEPDEPEDTKEEPKHAMSREERERNYTRERAKYHPTASRYSARRVPWLEGANFDHCNSITDVLNHEVATFARWMAPSDEEDEVRGLVVRQITECILKYYPDAKVQPFGSYATKLYLPSGDLDLVVLSDQMEKNFAHIVLRDLSTRLKQAGIADRVTVLGKAKVPIIKFNSRIGNFAVDISINQGNGLVGVKMINGFLRYMHHEDGSAIRTMVYIVKLFLSQRQMNEVFTGGLGSYAIVCLVISFFQMHPKIRNAEIDVEANLGVLVMEFFELYGCYFNYDDTGISIRDGGTYFSKRQRGWYNGQRGIMLSVEDPADPNNDISQGSYAFSQVKQTMAGAFTILASTVYRAAAILKARQDGSALRLREKYDPEDLSILSSIVTVPQDVINHRRLVHDVYESRVLHDLLGVPPTPSDMSLDSQAEVVLPADPPSASVKKHSRPSTSSAEESDDEGRYAIGKPPPTKRRKVEPVTYTVHESTSDSDSDSDSDSSVDLVVYGDEGEQNGSLGKGKDNGKAKAKRGRRSDNERDAALSKGFGEEDGEVDERPVRRRGSSSANKRNRDFWLAKGKGPPEVFDDNMRSEGEVSS
ncbi:hypothetical protein CYLTODRAFT_370984 [Cylindrobasidium torrendii FP15055 ss-10]|uniref:polynucleotide adenylyltransferase n=1 Tax=Cylindrobasidium torrendii FP15055 ss-10 TaxID=1314674 RepID=A0A0D7BIZ0_9AGAR|nr:hypothetical protein CYLTODRAFT_370984 [Cylindrobasidium torrendii FP15055 ss-10]